MVTMAKGRKGVWSQGQRAGCGKKRGVVTVAEGWLWVEKRGGRHG